MRLFRSVRGSKVYPERGAKGAVPGAPENGRRTHMNGRLQGFLTILDLLAEGPRRQAEVVTGRRFEAPAGILPVQAGNVVKFPLTGHQKRHLFAGARQTKVHARH